MNSATVSTNTTSVSSAKGASVLIGQYPFTKLDVTNIVSFQTISILFQNEPPQPLASPGFTDTLIYQFPHGYNYIPTVWMQWQQPEPLFPADPISSGLTSTTFYTFGDDTSSGNVIGVSTALSLYSQVKYNDSVLGVIVGTRGLFYVTVDTEKVSIYLRKVVVRQTFGNQVVPLDVQGTFCNMRVYVFTEPATTSTY